MRAGLLSERLTIQTPTASKDAVGGDVDAFVNGATIYAKRETIRADERFQSQSMGMQADYRFLIRNRTDVTKKTRLSWTPRWPNDAATVALEVHGVQPGEGRDELILDCGVFS